MQSEALRGKGSVANGCAGLQTVPASECGKSCAGAKAELGRSDLGSGLFVSTQQRNKSSIWAKL